MADESDSVCGVRHIDVEITIHAPVERVWQALVVETSSWWHRDFYTVSDPQGFILEPKAGGRGYEFNAAGAQVLWFTVIAVDPGVSLDLLATITRAYGGPTVSMLKWELAPSGNSTLFRITDSHLGLVSQHQAESFISGWREIFGDGLKPYLEGTR